jgi:hypothetical protein
MARRTAISSIFLLGAGPILALAAGQARAETTATTTAVGRLAVVRESYVNSGTPIPHVDERWKKIRLEWVSQDRRVRFFLEDEGGQLDANYTVYDQRHPEGVCMGGGFPQAYQPKGPAERRWRVTLRKQLDALLDHCTDWVTPAQRRSYLLEFAGAAADFGPALEQMKRAAVEDFGGWDRRCLKVKVDRDYSPSPRVTCLRYSGAVQ